jgi:hypothetical protein
MGFRVEQLESGPWTGSGTLNSKVPVFPQVGGISTGDWRVRGGGVKTRI